MNFKAYDILSSLIPGFLILVGLFEFFDMKYDKDLIVIYTAVAFLLGYIINTLSSWLEDLYFWTWGGKPSNNLLKSIGIWKVRFYHHEEVRQLLLEESGKPTPINDELFSIAMRYANQKDTRAEDFNAMYAFSRGILTTVILTFLLLINEQLCDWRFYAISVIIVSVAWLRCKQRAYYYAREVLTVYLKAKKPPRPVS